MRSRFHALDGLRGVSAVIVLLYHIGQYIAPYHTFSHGYLAVDVFFVMSGFVIANAYEEKLNHGLSVLAFVRARVRRLAPVYWAGTLVGGACFLTVLIWKHEMIAAAPLLTALLLGLLLVPIGGSDQLAFPLNGPAWSLFAEMAVNILYAGVMKKLGVRALLVIAAISFAICGWYALGNTLGWNFGWRTSQLLPAIFRACPSFAMGVVLYRLRQSGRLEPLPSLSPGLLILVWFGLLAVVPSNPFLWDMLVIALISPVLVALLVRSEETSPQWFSFAGALSYPLYVSHRMIVGLAFAAPFVTPSLATDPLYALPIIAVALAVAWAIHRLVDSAITTRSKIAEEPAAG